MPEAATELPIGAVADRPGVTVVDQSNWNAYVDQQMGPPAGATAEGEQNDDPEAVAAAEKAELDAKADAERKAADQPKEGDTDGSKVFFGGKWVSKHDFGYRVHLKAKEAEDAAQAKIDAAAAEAKASKDAWEAIVKERDELKAKYEPPKSDELGPEPTRDQFKDDAEYIKAVKDWAVEGDRKAQAIAQAQEAAQTRWKAAETALAAEIPDYAERLAKAPGADTQVSNELQAAILDSDIGPKLRLHLAENPDELKAMLAMPVGKMLKAVGKLEISLQSPAKADEKAQTNGQKPAQVAQISRAPAPITPLKGASAPAGVKIDANGNFYGTFEEYKAARMAGKIK